MKTIKLMMIAVFAITSLAFFSCNSSTDKPATVNVDKAPEKVAPPPVADNNAGKPAEMEEDHHVGELGKGPHGGTIEEAEPNHIEIMSKGKDLMFYLLDGDAKPIDGTGATGTMIIQYSDKSHKTIQLMGTNGAFTAMGANSGKAFTAVTTLTKDGQSYSATFMSDKDLSAQK